MAKECCNCQSGADKAIQTSSRRGNYICDNDDHVVARMRDMTGESGERVRVMRVQVEFKGAGDASKLFGRKKFDELTAHIAQWIQEHREQLLALGDEAKIDASEEISAPEEAPVED